MDDAPSSARARPHRGRGRATAVGHLALGMALAFVVQPLVRPSPAIPVQRANWAMVPRIVLHVMTHAVPRGPSLRSLPLRSRPLVDPPDAVDEDALAATAPGTDGAPGLSLPAMPGAVLLRDTAVYEKDSASWILTTAWRVPVQRAVAETFYRRALEQAGFPTPTIDDARTGHGQGVRMRAKTAHEHAQLTIVQHPRELDTRIRVITRVRGR